MESGKIIVVANQKGGVAKTSTVRNLSYALAEMGKKVLVVDFDPQYNLTTSFGVLPTQAPYNTGTLITNLLLDESLPDTNEFIQKIGSVDLIPSSRSLTVAEANLLMTPDSNDYLAALLNPLRLSYDYIIVDTNPSLGSLTINALTAADEVIIPIDPELFALTGLQALVDTIQKIKRKLNPSIEIGGILFTKCNKRTNLYEAGLAIISHSVVDFLAPEVKMYGQALLDIPCYKILMGCDGKNLQETKDLYNLTDAEQELLESKRRGHALFIIGSKRLHVNFEIPAYKFSYMGKAGGR